MPITRTPIINDDGTGTTGTVIDAAWKTEFYNQIDALVSPISAGWADVPFAAGNFTAVAPMTWTVAAGHILNNRYIVSNKTMVWSLFVVGSSFGGSASNMLHITIPAGLTARTYGGFARLAFFSDSGAGGGAVGRAYVDAPTTIAIQRDGDANFTIVPATVTLMLTITLELA